jgi:hypothetical protein
LVANRRRRHGVGGRVCERFSGRQGRRWHLLLSAFIMLHEASQYYGELTVAYG